MFCEEVGNFSFFNLIVEESQTNRVEIVNYTKYRQWIQMFVTFLNHLSKFYYKRPQFKQLLTFKVYYRAKRIKYIPKIILFILKSIHLFFKAQFYLNQSQKLKFKIMHTHNFFFCFNFHKLSLYLHDDIQQISQILQSPTIYMEGQKADYKMVKQIGQGSFGCVYLVQDKKGKKFALKKVSVDPFQVQQSMKEIQVMKKLVHVNLIRIFDSSFEESQGSIQILMQYCEQGDLLKYYKKKTPLSAGQIIKIFKQVVQAFIVMNAKGVIHRDLKPQNILISKGLVVKVADFGCARSVSTFQMSKIDNFSLDKGTPIYASPELLMSQKYSSKCDVWSAGVLLYFIYYGNHPFMDQKTHNTLKKIKQMTEGKVLQLPQDSDPTISRILSLTLIYEDRQRASWRQLWLSRLFVDKIDSVQSYLQYTKNITIIANWIAKQFWKVRKNLNISKHKDEFFVYFIIKFQCTCMHQAKQINKNNQKWKYLFQKQSWKNFHPNDILSKQIKKVYTQHEKYFVTIKKSMEAKEVYNLIKQKQTKRTSLYNDLDNSIRSAYKILNQVKEQIPSVNDGNDYKVWVLLARWINFQRWYWFQRDPRIQKFLIQNIGNPKLLIQTELQRYENGILE